MRPIPAFRLLVAGDSIYQQAEQRAIRIETPVGMGLGALPTAYPQAADCICRNPATSTNHRIMVRWENRDDSPSPFGNRIRPGFRAATRNHTKQQRTHSANPCQ